MWFLVAYASRYGATHGIARRIAGRLTAAGHEVDLRPVTAAGDPSRYDAVVLGSAIYLGHWRKAAVEFAEQHQQALATRPVWLFSSGPLAATVAPDACDLPIMVEPAEPARLQTLIRPRDHQVFAGALSPDVLGLRDRLIREIPGAEAILPAGDFRDWVEIDAWGDAIAREAARIAPVRPATRARGVAPCSGPADTACTAA